jgi:hypothetical protein
MVASFPARRNDSELRAALLKIENGVRGISLRKEGVSWCKLNDSSPQAGVSQKGGDVESGLFKFKH